MYFTVHAFINHRNVLLSFDEYKHKTIENPQFEECTKFSPLIFKVTREAHNINLESPTVLDKDLNTALTN